MDALLGLVVLTCMASFVLTVLTAIWLFMPTILAVFSTITAVTGTIVVLAILFAN
jgi:uncharacterized membrane protein YeaQ/YmgE (transglycosylase-associated protein family)